MSDTVNVTQTITLTPEEYDGFLDDTATWDELLRRVILNQVIKLDKAKQEKTNEHIVS